MEDEQKVHVDQEPVELYKILKLKNLVMSGGEAKYVIADGLVEVNGTTETRKRKKIYDGDLIEFQNIKMRIQVG